MNITWAGSSRQVGGLCASIATITLLLSGCSTPHGYGVDERAMRTPDGSSGVIAGADAPASSKLTPAMQSQSTYLSLITQMQHEGQYFASLAHLDAYQARYGRSPESTLLRGDAERLTDQPELAAQSYTALKETPLAGSGFRGLSLLAGARGDFEAASHLLEEAVRLNSTDAITLSDLGYARLKLHDFSRARVPLMTAAQLAPANPKVMSNVALYLILDHDTTQAEAVMKSAGVSAQTRQAIYLQAGQMSPDAGKGAVSAAPAALRIDFALATPAISSAAAPAASTTAR